MMVWSLFCDDLLPTVKTQSYITIGHQRAVYIPPKSLIIIIIHSTSIQKVINMK